MELATIEPLSTGIPLESLSYVPSPETFSLNATTAQVNENGGGPSTVAADFSLSATKKYYTLGSLQLEIYNFNGDGSARYTATLAFRINSKEIIKITYVLETPSTSIPDANYAQSFPIDGSIIFDSTDDVDLYITIDADGADYGFCRGKGTISGIVQNY